MILMHDRINRNDMCSDGKVLRFGRKDEKIMLFCFLIFLSFITVGPLLFGRGPEIKDLPLWIFWFLGGILSFIVLVWEIYNYVDKIKVNENNISIKRFRGYIAFNREEMSYIKISNPLRWHWIYITVVLKQKDRFFPYKFVIPESPSYGNYSKKRIYEFIQEVETIIPVKHPFKFTKEDTYVPFTDY
jgi:hypothetical protein